MARFPNYQAAIRYADKHGLTVKEVVHVNGGLRLNCIGDRRRKSHVRTLRIDDLSRRTKPRVALTP